MLKREAVEQQLDAINAHLSAGRRAEAKEATLGLILRIKAAANPEEYNAELDSAQGAMGALARAPVAPSVAAPANAAGAAVLLLLSVLFLAWCFSSENPVTPDQTSTLESQVQTEVSSHYAKENVQVGPVELVPKVDGREYTGFVDVEHGGVSVRKEVEVTVGGGEMMWKVK